MAKKNNNWFYNHPFWTLIIILFIFGFIFGIFSESSEDSGYEKIDPKSLFEKSGNENIEVDDVQVDDDYFSEISELHWGELPVKYFVRNEKECGKYETGQIDRAFREIAESTYNIL